MEPVPQDVKITTPDGTPILCRWPIDIHIDGDGSYVTLRLAADVNVIGKIDEIKD